MGEGKFLVTHARADDPDPGKVEAALEAWRLAVAEKVAAQGPQQEEKPLARIQVGPRRRLVKKKRAGG